MQTETRSYSCYLLNLPPTYDFLWDCAVIALARASAFLTLMMLMTSKVSLPLSQPILIHPPNMPACSFQTVLLSFLWFRSCKGSPQIQDKSPYFLAGHRSPRFSGSPPALSPATPYKYLMI